MKDLERLCVPNIFCVGAPKCGTTSLYHYLSKHPKVFLPKKKELHFFSRSEILKNMDGPGDSYSLDGCPPDLESYQAMFKEGGRFDVSIDISPSYWVFPESIARMREYNPDSKVIVMLRNPVEKAFSQYMHLVREGREVVSFEEGLSLEEDRRCLRYGDFWQYREGGLYFERLKKIFAEYGRGNTLVILQEDLLSRTEFVMDEIYSFLGIEPINIEFDKIFNRSGVPRSKIIARFTSPGLILSFLKKIIPYKVGVALKNMIVNANTGEKYKIPAHVRAELVSYYMEDVTRVSELLGIEIPWEEFRHDQ